MFMLPFSSGSQEQLLILCSELETHVKCDIRESEKCLYRSKVSMIVKRSSSICVYQCVFLFKSIFCENLNFNFVIVLKEIWFAARH